MMKKMTLVLLLFYMVIFAFGYNHDGIQRYRFNCMLAQRVSSSGAVIQECSNDVITFMYYSKSKTAVFESQNFTFRIVLNGECRYASKPHNCCTVKGLMKPGRMEVFTVLNTAQPYVGVITTEDELMYPLLHISSSHDSGSEIFTFHVSSVEAYNSQMKKWDKNSYKSVRWLLRGKLWKNLCSNFEAILEDDLSAKDYNPWD